jgi:ABC-type dipeptide/oligopeptide/nickel transport system permease component
MLTATSAIGRALGRGALTVIAVVTIAAIGLELSGEDVGERAARVAGLLPPPGERTSPEARARAVATVARERGVAGEPAARVLGAVVGVVYFDLGRAWIDGEAVGTHVGRALPVSLALVGVALLVAWALGLGGALLALAQPARLLDRLVAAGAAVALAVPVAWLAIVALRVFAWGAPWRLAPAHGSIGLAGLCLGVPAAALVARYGRVTLLAARVAPFYVAARARGASEARALLVHALAAAGSALLALLPVLVGGILGALPVVERAFDLPGLGAMIVDAQAIGDAPRVIGGAVIAAVLVWFSHAGAQVLTLLVDPRAREARG